MLYVLAFALLPLPSVSNFLRPEIEALEAATGVRPMVNQLEYHPFVPESTTALVRWCQAQGIAVTAYGSLGGSSSKAGESGPRDASAKRHSPSSLRDRWAKRYVLPERLRNALPKHHVSL